jgi:hypothetical protein
MLMNLSKISSLKSRQKQDKNKKAQHPHTFVWGCFFEEKRVRVKIVFFDNTVGSYNMVGESAFIKREVSNLPGAQASSSFFV